MKIISLLFRTYIHLIIIIPLILTNNTSWASTYFSQENETTIVELYGQLRVEGNQIVNQSGDPIVLRGMSLYWSQWIGKYYNYDCIKWLRDDWKCTVVRAAMAIEDGGYLSNPSVEMEKIKTVIDACIDLGIYVIVDWHDHNAHEHEIQAIEFFQEIATLYGDTPNIIYEIYNEPLQISWAEIVKPYSEAVTEAIRDIDSDNIVLAGTPTWSQDVDSAASNPLDFDNIAYVLHFYASSHGQSLRNKAKTALNQGVAIFVSEFGTPEYTGNGTINYQENELWFNFIEENKLSWCNWSVADISESSAALSSGASATGNWSNSDLSESGEYIRNKIIEGNLPIFTSLNNRNEYDKQSKSFIEQNYPNPFNSSTSFQFYLSSAQQVKIDIYNILGEKVTSLVNRQLHSGNHNVSLHSDNLSSGIYFYKYQTENTIQLGRMQLLK